MANFDTHSHCARCRDKGKGKEPCVQDPQSSNGQICNTLTSDQCQQLATPSYKLKKEKREAKLTEATPSQDSEQLVDPSSVSIIGAVDDQGSVKSPAPIPPPDKKPKKDKKKTIRRKNLPLQRLLSRTVLVLMPRLQSWTISGRNASAA